MKINDMRDGMVVTYQGRPHTIVTNDGKSRVMLYPGRKLPADVYTDRLVWADASETAPAR